MSLVTNASSVAILLKPRSVLKVDAPAYFGSLARCCRDVEGIASYWRRSSGAHRFGLRTGAPAYQRDGGRPDQCGRDAPEVYVPRIQTRREHESTDRGAYDRADAT